jgi:hypothetical protein
MISRKRNEKSRALQPAPRHVQTTLRRCSAQNEPIGFNLFEVAIILIRLSQGSSFVATLGWSMESLRDIAGELHMRFGLGWL